MQPRLSKSPCTHAHAHTKFKIAGEDLFTISRQGREVLGAFPKKTPENHL